MKKILAFVLLIPFFACAQTKTPQDVVNLIKKNVTCKWATERWMFLRPGILKIS